MSDAYTGFTGWSQVRALDLRELVEHRIWDAVVGAVADVGLEERVANALWEAFFERAVTAGYYRGLTEVSPATATHDLRALVAAGLLSARGERRGRRYLPGPRLYERVGTLLGVDEASEREHIVRVLAQRISAEARSDAEVEHLSGRIQRRVDVRHVELGRDSVLDYQIGVSDNDRQLGAVRASLSPEAWMRIGRLLDRPGWPLPSGELIGDAAKVAEAFVDVIVDVVADDPDQRPTDVRVGSTGVPQLVRAGVVPDEPARVQKRADGAVAEPRA